MTNFYKIGYLDCLDALIQDLKYQKYKQVKSLTTDELIAHFQQMRDEGACKYRSIIPNEEIDANPKDLPNIIKR